MSKMVNFIINVNLAIVSMLCFEKLFIESRITDPQQFRPSLRQERIDAQVCEDEKTDEQDEEWDLCNKTNFVPTTLAPNFNANLPHEAISKPPETYCFCDEECDDYNDCCSDFIPKIQRSNIHNELSCIDLFSKSVSFASVYGVNRCKDNWVEIDIYSGVREKCEFDSYDLKIMAKDFSYLQDIAVFSETTKIMYRNLFCAVCNNDSTNLMQLNMSVECGGNEMKDLLRNENHSSFLQNYDPFHKKWKVFSNKQMTECSIAVKEFGNLDFIKDNKLRKCRKTISKCPQNWNDSTVAKKCESYVSYVYESYNEIKSYKNFHCALCNGAKLRYLTCFPKLNVSEQSTTGVRRLWFPLLLDFNFGGDKGEWIGGNIKCPNIGEIYDPIYEKCIFIFCGPQYRKDDETGLCLPINDMSRDNTDFESNCYAIIILDEKIDFILLQNKSIYINKTKIVLNQSQYEVYDENYEFNKTTLKVKICANESSFDISSIIQSPFDVSFGQIVLSAISLYTSIICLILHLMVYSILPKLRNLPGKNLVSLSGSLLMAHISFVISSYIEADRRIACVLIAIITHYSYLATFCWMSVMAFDVCKTFSQTNRRESKRYTFLKYSLYAWLLPAIIIIISAAFDIGLEDSHFQPLYGYRFCWISQRQALLVFFAIPVAVIVSINIILFSLTAKGLIKTAEQTKILNKNSDKVRYYLYIKLAFVMGLTWVFGFIASLTDFNILWYPFICLNGLQGAIIFFAFTFKRKIWNLLMEKFGFKAGFIRPSKTTTSSDIIRSATGSSSLQTSTLIPSSSNTNVTKIKFTN